MSDFKFEIVGELPIDVTKIPEHVRLMLAEATLKEARESILRSRSSEEGKGDAS